MTTHWAPSALRITTPRLELRYTADEDIPELARIVANVVDDVGLGQFWSNIYHDDSPGNIATWVMQRLLHYRNQWRTDDWLCPFTVWHEGTIVGSQFIVAKEFSIARSCVTSSFVDVSLQNQGLGKEMRAAALHFLFAGLDSVESNSDADERNVASQAVSRAMGYRDNGETRKVIFGEAVADRQFRITRDEWETHRRDDITISGLDECRDWFVGETRQPKEPEIDDASDRLAWPLEQLRITTPRMELRYPQPDEVDQLAEIMTRVHNQPGTDWIWANSDSTEPGGFTAHALRVLWGWKADWRPNNWDIPFGVYVDGHLVGVQEIFAKNFALVRSADTGSWIDPAAQGQGFGKEARAAVLHFIFTELDAVEARSTALIDNAASIAVSHALGYRDDGILRGKIPNGQVGEEQRFVLPRQAWEVQRRDDISVTGFDEECRAFFGI